MNAAHAEILDWIDGQLPTLTQRLIEWASINSGSTNLTGLDRFRAVLREAFAALGGEITEIKLAPMESIDRHGNVMKTAVGKALSIVKRPGAAVRVFLCIHMDTVYPLDHPFQICTRIDENTLQGPGVADAKGGLLVMLTALAAIERSPLAEKIGWEVLINPDEEIGSLSSLPLLNAAAKRNRVGLLFEPAMPDGALVDRRKGSGNFTAVVRGRSAHAGRDFSQGRNAIVAASAMAIALDELNRELKGITVNVGAIRGGGPTNVVPDLAILRFNVRTGICEDEAGVLEHIKRLIAELHGLDGITAMLHGGFTSPPKIPDACCRELMDLIGRCGQGINLPIHWKGSGGVCDGNKLAAAGLANVDTLGPIGGNLHSPREYVLLDSLTQRAKLAALVILGLSNGEKSF